MIPQRLPFARALRLRRRHTKDPLIVEIGGGHNPDFRSDVLVDKFLYDNSERAGALVSDRPTLIADGEHLPFKDKSFGYSIARHVMEHTNNIELFFTELARISDAGFLTSPSPLAEFLYGWPFHHWVINLQDGCLLCARKTDFPPPPFGRLFHHFYKHNEHYEAFHNSAPQGLFEIRYEWRGKIRYRVTDTFCIPDFEGIISLTSLFSNQSKLTTTERLRRLMTRHLPLGVLSSARRLISRLRRPNTLSMAEFERLLACPQCKGNIDKLGDKFVCPSCSRAYPILSGIPDFTVP